MTPQDKQRQLEEDLSSALAWADEDEQLGEDALSAAPLQVAAEKATHDPASISTDGAVRPETVTLPR